MDESYTEVRNASGTVKAGTISMDSGCLEFTLCHTEHDNDGTPTTMFFTVVAYGDLGRRLLKKLGDGDAVCITEGRLTQKRDGKRPATRILATRVFRDS